MITYLYINFFIDIVLLLLVGYLFWKTNSNKEDNDEHNLKISLIEEKMRKGER